MEVFSSVVVVLLVGLADSWVLGGGWVSAADTTDPQRPNILFILADDLGYGDLGCYGQRTIQTPNIDKLAAEGLRCTSVYAGTTVCAPSRCSLMTGLHTGHCVIRGNDRVPLRPEDVTVAEVLKKRGYTTGIIGKWGLGEPESTGVPNRKGFDYFFGYLNQQHAHNYYPDYLWRNEEKVRLKNVIKPVGDVGAGIATERAEYAPDLFTREALAFLERNQRQPFFLYLTYIIPHANNEAGKQGMEVPDYGPYASQDWPEPEKGFAGMVHRLDRDVGLVLRKLKELGLAENTIVFFSSDNGPHKEGGNNPYFFNSRGPLRGIKRDLYEGGIRVPMIVRWPGRIKPDGVSDQPWAFWDFLPTAAELAGAQPPDNLDGISMLPALLGQPQKNQHEFFYWEFHEQGSSQAVRMGNWKAVRNGRRAAPLELYNLAQDLGEDHNVATDYPEVVAKIENYLQTARTESANWPLQDRKPPGAAARKKAAAAKN